ncbi:MAG: hypothetical protein QNJ49_19255, partial [Mastigocoleus sp. MO_167.B18]|nr:hypothetical protein [Mastigocoleus sp. MO_167.B18]
ACTPGLETLLNSNTKPSEPKPPPNPDIPTLPQKDSPVIQQERQLQIEQTRQEYQVGLRLPNSVRVETLPPQEVFSEGYNANRATLGKLNINIWLLFPICPELFINLFLKRKECLVMKIA